MIFKTIINIGVFLIIALLSTSALTYLGVGYFICLIMLIVGFILWEIFFFANGNEI